MALAAYEHNNTEKKGKASSDDTGGSGEVQERQKNVPLTARDLMQKGYEAVCFDPSIEAGGSTAVVALLQPQGSVEVANLGDSGFMHLRPNRIEAFTSPQTHAFNTPFQLSVVPPATLQRMAAFGGTQFSDLPRDADVSRHSVRHGDVLIFASDGVWDNLFDQDVLHVVSGAMTATRAWKWGRAGMEPGTDIALYTRVTNVADGPADPTAAALRRLQGEDQQLPPQKRRILPTVQSLVATRLVAAAKAASINAKLDGPFAREVNRVYPAEKWSGGKVDDICVVAVVVAEARPDLPSMTA
jgi:protein phosphatase PTC7